MVMLDWHSQHTHMGQAPLKFEPKTDTHISVSILFESKTDNHISVSIMFESKTDTHIFQFLLIFGP